MGDTADILDTLWNTEVEAPNNAVRYLKNIFEESKLELNKEPQVKARDYLKHVFKIQIRHVDNKFYYVTIFKTDGQESFKFNNLRTTRKRYGLTFKLIDDNTLSINGEIIEKKDEEEFEVIGTYPKHTKNIHYAHKSFKFDLIEELNKDVNPFIVDSSFLVHEYVDGKAFNKVGESRMAYEFPADMDMLNPDGSPYYKRQFSGVVDNKEVQLFPELKYEGMLKTYKHPKPKERDGTLTLKEYAKTNAHLLPEWQSQYKKYYGAKRAVIHKDLDDHICIHDGKIIVKNKHYKSRAQFNTKIKQALYALIKYATNE